MILYSLFVSTSIRGYEESIFVFFFFFYYYIFYDFKLVLNYIISTVLSDLQTQCNLLRGKLFKDEIIINHILE